MKRIEQIWAELESSISPEIGILYKRLSGEVLPPVYIAMKYPERLRCIAVHLESDSVTSSFNLCNLKDIRIDKMNDTKNPGKFFFLIVLANNQHKDIFSTLSEDLINLVSSITQEAELIKKLINRLEKWRLLFEKVRQQGLSNEAQLGLYGELFFLRKFLYNSENFQFCIDSWKGPERAVQDYQYADWAVEIKSTLGKNQQKLYISSERQLDISIISKVFLVHYSFEARQNYGETLNDIVDDLFKILSNNHTANYLFNLRLLEADYFLIHRHIYSIIGYSIRKENIYKITDNFPKITESMVPSGVGDVHYSLVVPSNKEYILNENELFEIIKPK